MHPERDGQAADDVRATRLFLCGDVMTGRGVDQIMRSPSDPVLYESFMRSAEGYVRLAQRESGPIDKPVAADYLWGHALNVWDEFDPDLRLINLETSVTTSGDHWPDKGIHYRMHPHNADCLTAAKIDCCALANNHVLDWGRAGLADTLATLERRRISVSGAGRNRAAASAPARLGTPGKPDVLVFACAEPGSGVPPHWSAGAERSGIWLLPDLSPASADRVVERIRQEQRPHDIVVVSIHWGGNWGYRIPADQRRFAHRLIDRGGVDVVQGHSSHHPKAIERYRERTILYGCGDFLNDYEGIGGQAEYRPWLSLMYFLTLDPQLGHTTALDIVPLQIRRMRLEAATADDTQWLSGRLNSMSEPLGARFDASDGRLHLTAQRQIG